MLKKVGLISLMSVSLMSMSSVDLNVNDVDLEIGANLDIGQFNYAVEPDTSFLGIKYLKPDRDYSDFNSTESYIEGSFMTQRSIGSNGFYAGLGIKLNYIKSSELVISPDGNSTETPADGNTTTASSDTNGTSIVKYGAFSSIPLVLMVGYRLPNFPVDIHASVAFAPQVLSFKDAKAFSEYRIGLDIYIIENAALSLGYRNIKLKYQDSTKYNKYNGAAYGGFHYRF